MNKVFLLDCTLRDGGYINDWNFGFTAIKGFSDKISKTGVEFYEIGFLKNIKYDRNRTLFSCIDDIKKIVVPKSDKMKYIAMIDINDKIPIENIPKCDCSSIDGLRIIFKKNKIRDAYEYCEQIKKLGYMVFVQFVSTDIYTDDEFRESIKMFNKIEPYAVSIVDTFGLMNKKLFLRYVSLADNFLDNKIVLGYHAHNNLQQAQSNAEAFVELNLKRDIVIDGCVFGMGRGAGNLNLELFAQYLNEHYQANYNIEPMLEIMDEYLNDIYKEKFWGYSLPLYLSAINACHPNYAIYLAEKNCLTEKSFSELLKQISFEDKQVFSKEKADKYYLEYQQNLIDDTDTIECLKHCFKDKNILLIAPGRSILDYKDKIDNIVDCITLSVNFKGLNNKTDYIFCSNMKRYVKIENNTKSKCIITSNMKEAHKFDYMINFSSYICNDSLIIDNSGVMALKLLEKLGVRKVYIAGMDGYSDESIISYADKSLEFDFSSVAEKRNQLISQELSKISKNVNLEFVTPTKYEVKK